MEILVGIIILTAGFFAGGAKKEIEVQKPMTQLEECANMCEKGVVAEYKFCKCKEKPLWSK